ncbi:MFS transporter [Anoxybacillus ayderensis G10]|nr:MFS transporter [Anoxybacillus ayderensis G10]
MQYKIHSILFILIVFIAQAYLVLIPLIAMDLFNDKEFVASLGVIQTAGGFIFGLLGIFIIDNIKNKYTLVFSSIVIFLILVSQIFFPTEFKLVFAISLIIFIVFSRIVENVQNALMFAEYHKRGDSGLEFFNSLISSTYIIIGTVIAPISVLAYKFFGLVFLMILTLLIIIITFFIKVASSNKTNKERVKPLRERLNLFFGNKKLSLPIFIINSVMLSAMMVTTIFFLYITQDLGYSTFKYSILLAIESVGSVLISMYFYGKYLKTKPKLIPLFILIFGILYLLFGFINFSFSLLALLAFLKGGCVTSILMMLNERYQKNCPKEIYGTVNSIRITLNNISGLVGTSIGSSLYINFGSTAVFVCTFSLLVLFSFITYLCRKELIPNVDKGQNLRNVFGGN